MIDIQKAMHFKIKLFKKTKTVNEEIRSIICCRTINKEIRIKASDNDFVFK